MPDTFSINLGDGGRLDYHPPSEATGPQLFPIPGDAAAIVFAFRDASEMMNTVAGMRALSGQLTQRMASPPLIICAVATNGIEALDEAAMNGHGWFRLGDPLTAAAVVAPQAGEGVGEPVGAAAPVDG